MLYSIYVTYDSKTKASSAPWFNTYAPEYVLEALTRDARKGEESILKSKDNIIYYLGSYDDNNMNFNLLAEPKEVVVIAQLILDCFGGNLNA